MTRSPNKTKSSSDAPLADQSPSLASDLLAKVQVMSNLTNACKNPDLVKLINGLPDGERIYSIFVAAIEREVESIMTGSERPDVAVKLQDSAQAAMSALQQAQELLTALTSSQLIEILGIIAKNLSKPTPSPTQSAPKADVSTVNQAQAQQNYQQYRRDSGINSF